MPYSPASIANAFLTRAFRDRRKIDPMKMQKLCYLAHGYCLAQLDRPLLDERFEAWKFGPVLPSLYHLLKGYRWYTIQEHLKDYDYETRRYVDAPIPTDAAVNEIIDFVWDEYGEMHAVDLSDWTHEKNGPWDQVIKSEPEFVRNMIIPNDMIAEYFIRNMYSDGAAAA
jgi:uncharacterized phage-associated protein